MSEDTLIQLKEAHDWVQALSKRRRDAAILRTLCAKEACAAGASVKELQELLGLSRTGVVKILNG